MISKQFIKDQKIKEEIDRQKRRAEALKQLRRLKLPQPKEISEDDIIPFPENVTDVPSEDLGQYLAVYEGAVARIEWCIAEIEIEQDHAQELLDFIYNKKYTEEYKDGTATERKMQVESDEFYLKCKLEVSVYEDQLKLMRKTSAAYQGYARSISREITSRKDTQGWAGRSDDTFRGNSPFVNRPKKNHTPTGGRRNLRG
jgi:hypothetical protein